MYFYTACCCCCVASVVSNSVQPHRRQPARLPRPWDSPGKNTGVGCHFLLQCMKVISESEVTQSCPTLHNPMECSLPGSSEYWKIPWMEEPGRLQSMGSRRVGHDWATSYVFFKSHLSLFGARQVISKWTVWITERWCECLFVSRMLEHLFWGVIVCLVTHSCPTLWPCGL